VIENACGEYVTWLDSDQVLENGFLRKQLEFIERHPEAGIVTARMGIPSEHSSVLDLDIIPALVESSTQNWIDPSKVPGTGGATYRVRAAHQVGGFDENMVRGGEDTDIAGRIKRAGWQILRGNATFYEKHGGFSTWRGLWQRYIAQGRYSRGLYDKTNGFISLYRMNPIASFVAGARYSIIGYRATRLKIAFLLPFHFVFKMTAWFYGFTKE
jgi:GT2 family glycosyltransferase